MKYIIELPDEFAEATKEYWDKTVGLQLEPYIESDRGRIENEIWDFVKKIECLTIGEIEDCFDVEYEGVPFVANMFSFQEAKNKYDEWLKQRDEIKVGDEVIPMNTLYDRMIVTRTWNDDYLSDCVDTIGFDGNIGSFLKSKVKKTGRHFDEVSEMLKKLKGEKND